MDVERKDNITVFHISCVCRAFQEWLYALGYNHDWARFGFLSYQNLGRRGDLHLSLRLLTERTKYGSYGLVGYLLGVRLIEH